MDEGLVRVSRKMRIRRKKCRSLHSGNRETFFEGMKQRRKLFIV
jgi:hypothetical protein